jgi:hypothetical protein
MDLGSPYVYHLERYLDFDTCWLPIESVKNPLMSIFNEMYNSTTY